MNSPKRNMAIFCLCFSCFLVILSIVISVNSKKTNIQLSDTHPTVSPFNNASTSDTVTITDITIPNAPSASANNTTTYNLKKYCNNVDATQDFIKFVSSLDEAENKLLIIPNDKTLL